MAVVLDVRSRLLATLAMPAAYFVAPLCYLGLLSLWNSEAKQTLPLKFLWSGLFHNFHWGWKGKAVEQWGTETVGSPWWEQVSETEDHKELGNIPPVDLFGSLSLHDNIGDKVSGEWTLPLAPGWVCPISVVSLSW